MFSGQKMIPCRVEVAEVGRRGQCRRRPMARDRDIGEVIPIAERRDPRVLDPELLHRRIGQERDGRHLLDRPAIAAPHHPQVRDERQPHQAVGLALHDPRIEHLDRIIGQPVDRRTFAGHPSRRGREARPSLARTLRHPDQEDHLVPRDDRPRVEDPDHLEVVVRRLQIGRPQQQPLEMPLQQHGRLLSQEAEEPCRIAGVQPRTTSDY